MDAEDFDLYDVVGTAPSEQQPTSGNAVGVVPPPTDAAEPRTPPDTEQRQTTSASTVKQEDDDEEEEEGKKAGMSESAAQPHTPEDTAVEQTNATTETAAAETADATVKPEEVEKGPNENAHQKSVYVGNMAWWTTEDEVYELFGAYGKVKAVTFGEHRLSGKSKGFAKVEYASEDCAWRAVEALNGKVLPNNPGKPLILAFPRQPNDVMQMGQGVGFNPAVMGGAMMGARPGMVGAGMMPFGMPRPGVGAVPIMAPAMPYGMSRPGMGVGVGVPRAPGFTVGVPMPGGFPMMGRGMIPPHMQVPMHMPQPRQSQWDNP